MLIFDIETNGLLEDTTQLHCMAIYDSVTGKTRGYDLAHVREGVMRLLGALAVGEEIAGHNIISFDLPALAKLYPDFCVSEAQRTKIIDTLILSLSCFARYCLYAERGSPFSMGL